MVCESKLYGIQGRATVTKIGLYVHWAGRLERERTVVRYMKGIFVCKGGKFCFWAAAIRLNGLLCHSSRTLILLVIWTGILGPTLS